MALEAAFREWRRRQSFAAALKRQFLDIAAVYGFSEAPSAAGALPVDEEAVSFLEAGFAVKLCSADKSGFAAAAYGLPAAAAEAELIVMMGELLARFDLVSSSLTLFGPEDERLAELSRRLEMLNIGFVHLPGEKRGFAISLPGQKKAAADGVVLENGAGCFIDPAVILDSFYAGSSSAPNPQVCDLYLAAVGEEAALLAMKLAIELRSEGFAVEAGLARQPLSVQQAVSRALNANFWMLLDQKVLAAGSAEIESASGETQTLAGLDSDTLSRFLYDAELGKITESFDGGAFAGLFGGTV